MKIAIEYSGYLRFIKDTYPLLSKIFVSNENTDTKFLYFLSR